MFVLSISMAVAAVARSLLSEQVCAYLVRISIQVKVLQEAGGKLTKEKVVSVVDGPETPVGVVVGAGAGAEGAH